MTLARALRFANGGGSPAAPGIPGESEEDRRLGIKEALQMRSLNVPASWDENLHDPQNRFSFIAMDDAHKPRDIDEGASFEKNPLLKRPS
jgi:hypothetical protein